MRTDRKMTVSFLDMTEDEEKKAMVAKDILHTFLSSLRDPCLEEEKIGDVLVFAGEYHLMKGEDIVTMANGLSAFLEGCLYILTGRYYLADEVRKNEKTRRMMRRITKDTYGITVYRMLEYEHWI